MGSLLWGRRPDRAQVNQNLTHTLQPNSHKHIHLDEDKASPHLFTAKVHQIFAIKLDVTLLENIVAENKK